MSLLKVESAVVVVLGVCVFLAFYFVYLSFQTVDEVLKKQLVFVAASSVITGAVLFACLTIYLGIKKAFSGMGDQLKTSDVAEQESE